MEPFRVEEFIAAPNNRMWIAIDDTGIICGGRTTKEQAEDDARALNAAFKLGQKVADDRCPYWAHNAMAEALKGHPCERVIPPEDDDTCCSSTSDDITEWCAACYALLWWTQRNLRNTKGAVDEKNPV